MSPKRQYRSIWVAALALTLALFFGCLRDAPSPTGTDVRTQATFALDGVPLSGAIFTTTVDGDIVNENVHYTAKEDVYLDGGPGPNAPVNAAGLPEGDYYFQVTDPSGKDLLSSDHISCRMIHVNGYGVIDMVYAGTNYEWSHGDFVEVPCQHAEGVDQDHGGAPWNAITVQLYPYDDTPNKGGVYKVWITPTDKYLGDPDLVPPDDANPQFAVNGENWEPGNFHGFDPRWSKTDNYKVREKVVGPPCPTPYMTVRKFHDANLNGVQDEGEDDVAGWTVAITEPLGVTNGYPTPVLLLTVDPGTYIVEEDVPDGVLQTVSLLNGDVVSSYPTADPVVDVDVAGDCEEVNDVVYGNAGLGSATACKYFDRDGDGVADDDEPGVAGWKFELNGTDVLGNTVGPIVGTTDDTGCVTFGDLLPGSYTITELMPTNYSWTPTGDTEVPFDIESTLDGSDISGTDASFDFTNICFGEADFGTKGYWHNKNGLTEIEEAFVMGTVNMLDPYDSPSDYFDDGDEPFDGMFENGDPVDAAFNDDGDPIWGAGTWQAEVSQFLVDANAGGDPAEQLAQQLLAFIFNVEYRLGGTAAMIELPDGTYVNAGDLIDEAIDIWANGTPEEQVAIKDVLDALNNNDAVHYVPGEPCPVTYP